MEKKVAIIGAAGYVGQFMVEEFNLNQITPTTVTRSNGLFLLSQKKVNALTIDQVKSESFTEKFDVVINFAYPSGGSAFYDKKRNDDIIDLVEKLIHKDSKIIHTSTIAVFGYKLERPVVTERVKTKRDWDYIESKVYFENRLLDKFKSNEVHVVRLGNVWGPASPSWTASIANNVLYGQPTAVHSMDGYSNCTDVRNISSYLKFLTDYSSKGPGYHIHHLAEFYNTKWSYFQNKFSSLFDMPIEYVYNFSTAEDASSLFTDVRRQLSASLSPTDLVKKLYATKVSGSYIRTMLSLLPAKYLVKANRTYNDSLYNPTDAVDNPIFFLIMSCQKEFENKTWEGWVPPVSLEQSWAHVEDWIKEIKLDY